MCVKILVSDYLKKYLAEIYNDNILKASFGKDYIKAGI